MGCFVSKPIKLLILLGSARTKSANTGLVHAIQKFHINKNTNIELVILPLDAIPIFNEDEEHKETLNIEILNLRRQAQMAKAILFVTPEINGSISPLILNAFVWLSRIYDKKKGSPLALKKGGVMSASFLSENQIADCLQIGKIANMNIFSETYHLPLGNKSVNQQGKLFHSAQIKRLQDWYKTFVEFILKK